MVQQSRDASSHPDEPPAKRRTLQIKLGRPRPSSDFSHPEQPSPSLNRSRPGHSHAIRISLKRKSTVSESQAAPSRLAAYPAEDQDEDDDRDEDENEDDDQDVGTLNASEQDDDDREPDNAEDDQQDDDGEEEQDEEEEDQQDDLDENQDGEGDNVDSVARGNAASNPRTRGLNGAFRSISAGTANPSRRPIKRLRSKGLYEALPKLIENLQRRDSYKFFCEPVNPDEVPGYSDVIKSPMDFGTMQRKVQDRLYSHMDQVKADFQLVISNAMTFNPEGTLYYNEAKRIAAWGNRAIEREGMAVNDNGRAGLKGEEMRRQRRLEREAATVTSVGVLEGPSSVDDGHSRRPLRGSTANQQPALDDASQQRVGDQNASEELTTRSAARGSRFAFSAGVEALMEAARVTSQARQRAAIALGLTGGTLTREDSVQPGAGVKAEGNADMDIDDDEDEDVSDEEGGIRANVTRERSVTVDCAAGVNGRQCGSSQPCGTPSTPLGQRQASPGALRRRLAAVTGTPAQALASPMGALSAVAGGTSRASKHSKHRKRLSAPGTPKRLLARTGLTGSGTPLASVASSSGAATDSAGLTLDPAATAAAAAQLIADLSQTQIQTTAASYSFEDNGSINPEDIDDLQAFLTLHRSGKHILMPTIESLHPIPFIPGDYITNSGAEGKAKDQDKEQERSKEKEKAKDKGATDDGDDEDEDGKGDTREKGDKDPLSTLPPSRPGAPDPLYSAIAPEPEPLQSNLSHDVEPLPRHFRNLPFHAPSLPTRWLQDQASYGVLHSWDNPAYAEALKNDKRPKKQKDKEREKERETLEDWSYFRPTLTRLLEITDLGPFTALVPTTEQDQRSEPAKMMAKGKTARATKGAQAVTSPTPAFSTTLLGEQGIQAIKTELGQSEEGLRQAQGILMRYIGAAKAGIATTRNGSWTQAEQQAASRYVSDTVYAGVTGNAYVRSVGEFVGGAIHHAMLLDEADDAEEQQIAEAEKKLLLAAAMRKVTETEATPEPSAASRRGPFMWRDTTEEAAGTATPSVGGEPDTSCVAHTTALGTWMAELEDSVVKPVISEVLEDLEKGETKLAPLRKPLAHVVEEEVIRPITGHTLDVLHLVAVLLEAHGFEELNVDEIEARLLRNKMRRHGINGGEVQSHAAPRAQAVAEPASATNTFLAPSQPPIPFQAELDWLQGQPDLSKLLDEARLDVDSLGSIVNYIVQSA